jgi:arylsulfatase A-like enzyme
MSLMSALALAALPLRIDHQFRAPGDPNGVFDSRFNDPEVLKSYGYTSQAGRYCEVAVPFDTLPGPKLFPVGSEVRAWMDAYAAVLQQNQAEMKASGLRVLNHMDFIVLPRLVLERYAGEVCVGGGPPPCAIRWSNVTAGLINVMFNEMFALFPLLDGVLVRTGEHYIIDLPFHVAGRPHPDPDFTDPITWLRDELAAKRDKLVVWRTWSVHPVTAADAYLNLTDAIAPHKNLHFSAKHQGWDYWRYVNFNPILGRGRHPQIVEASCQRSYEGKGAFPSYVARGIIDGFPEQSLNPSYTGGVRGLRDVVNVNGKQGSSSSSTVVGLWTWSRGDGNWGPYTKAGELWQDLNCEVLCRWASHPSASEADVFAAVATGPTFALSAADAAVFRRIALLAEDAVLHGRYCEKFDVARVPAASPSNTWMRDYATSNSIHSVSKWLAAHGETEAARAEKSAAVAAFEQIRSLVATMAFDSYAGPKRLSRVDPQFPARLRSTAESAVRFFTAVEAAWRVATFGAEGEASGKYNVSAISSGAQAFHSAWFSYQAYLLACPTCGTTMFDEFCEDAQPATGGSATVLPGTPVCKPGMAAMVDQINATAHQPPRSAETEPSAFFRVHTGAGGGVCPAPQADTCVRTPKGVYAVSSGRLTWEECCNQCVKDGTLCYAYIFTRNGPNATGKCQQVDAPINPSSVYKGNCAVGTFPHRIKPAAGPPGSVPSAAKNVLFLLADDMRPSIGPYAAPGEPPPYSTPALDSLAKTGVTFARAFVQIAYCAPSRNSIMSGRRPDAMNVYSFIGTYRNPSSGQDWVALPELFVQNGYNVGGSGKLFHPGVPADFDQPWSWSDGAPYLEYGDNATNKCAEPCCGISDKGATFGPGQEGAGHYCAYELEPGTYLSDQRNTMVAIDRLKQFGTEYNQTGKPFFVGLGFHKPHLPWHFPKRFWDATPANPPVAKHQAFPSDVPSIGWHECAECSTWANPENSTDAGRIAYFNTRGEGMPLPNQRWQSDMRRAYYSAIAYVDDLIGQTLGELSALGLARSTVVSFTSDHGWSTGEHDVWCKMTNSEAGTRVPLLIRAPWMHAAAGTKSRSLSELVDLYPTLAELAGIALPTGRGGAHLGGTSLVPAMRDPSVSVKNVALSQFPRCFQNNTGFDMNSLAGPGDEVNKTNSLMSMSDCHWVRPSALDFMGYGMRTDKLRYVQWMVWDGGALRPRWDQIVGRELYDHTLTNQMDNSYFDETENENMASLPQHAGLVAQLEAQLKKEVSRWFA